MSDNPRLKSNNRRSKPKEHENYGQQGTKPNGTSTRPHQSYAHSPHQPTSTSTSSPPSLSSSTPTSSATSPPTSSSPSLSSSTSSYNQPSPSLHPSSHKPSHPQPSSQSQPNDHSDPPQSSPHLHSSHSNSQTNHSQPHPHPHSHSRSHSQSDSYSRSHPHPHSHSHSHSDSPGQPNGANGFHRRGSRHERTHSNPHAHTHAHAHAHAHAHSSPHQHHSHNQHPRNHQEPQQSQQQLQEDNKPTPPPESTELSPAQIETHLLHMWNITYDRARNPKIPEHERPLIYRDVAKAWGSESKNPVFAGDFNFSVELKKSFLAKFGTLAQRSSQVTSGDENGKNNINTNNASNNNNNVHSSSEENGKSVNNAVNREASYSNINNINNTNTNTNANETNTTNSTNNNVNNNNKNKNKKNKRDAQPTVDSKPNGKTTTKQQDHQNSEKQIPKEQITEPKELKQKLKQESKQEPKQDIKDTKHEAKETKQQEKHDAKQQKQDTKEPEPTPIKPEPQQQEIIPDAKQPEMAELETKVEEEEQEEEEEEETEEQVDEVYDYDFTNDEYEEISDPVDAQKGNPGDAIIDIPDMDDDAPQPTKQNGKSKAKPKKTKKGKSKPVKHHDSEKAVEPKNSNTTTSNITFSNINNNNFTNNIINLTSNGNNEAWNDILGNLLPRPKAEITKASGTNTLQLDNAGNFTLAQDTAQANAALLNGIPREVVRVFANRFGKPNPTPNTDFPGILPVKWSSGEGLTSAGRKFPMEVPFLSLKDMFGSSNNKPTSKLSCANLRCQNTTTEDKPFKTCAKCNMTAYCSRDCQKEDWTKRHKQSCKSNAAEEQRKTFATQKFWATASIRHMIFLHWYGRYGKGVIILMCKDFLAYGEDDPSGRDLYIFYMPMADVMSEDCPIPALKKCQAEFAKSFVNHDTDSHSIASAAVDSTGFVTPQIDDVKVLQLKLHKRSCKDHDLQKVDAIAVDSHNQATLYTFH